MTSGRSSLMSGSFEGDTRLEITQSLDKKLQMTVSKDRFRPEVRISAVNGPPVFTDVGHSDEDQYLETLFPLVKGVYRRVFWESIVKYFRELESELLAVRDEESLGRAFEYMVLCRLQVRNMTCDEVRVILNEVGLMTDAVSDSGILSVDKQDTAKLFEQHCFIWEATQFPKLYSISRVSRLCIPSSPIFPAVDALIHVGPIVFAIKTTVSKDKPDEMHLLIQKAKVAGWDSGGITAIVLVYLSLDEATAKALKQNMTKKNKGAEQVAGQPFTVKQVFWSRNDLTCLRRFSWEFAKAVKVAIETPVTRRKSKRHRAA